MESMLKSGDHVANLVDYYLVKSEFVAICQIKERKGNVSYQKCKQYRGNIGDEFNPTKSRKGGKLKSVKGACNTTLAINGAKKSKYVLLSLTKSVENEDAYVHDLNPIYLAKKEIKLKKQKKLLKKIQSAKTPLGNDDLPTIQIQPPEQITWHAGSKKTVGVKFTIGKRDKSPLAKCKCAKPLVIIDSSIVACNTIDRVNTKTMRKGANAVEFTIKSLNSKCLNENQIPISIYDEKTRIQLTEPMPPIPSPSTRCPGGYHSFLTHGDGQKMANCDQCHQQKNAICCEHETTGSFHCQCPPGIKGELCKRLGPVGVPDDRADKDFGHKAAMSVVVAASLVIALLIGGVVVYCISKQKRKENRRRSRHRRRQSEHRVDHTNLTSGSADDSRGDGPLVHREMRPMYHRQNGNTRFVPNQQSRRSQGLGDTHALLRDGTSTAGSILRPQTSTFGVPPETQNGIPNNSRSLTAQCDAESDNEVRL